MKHDSTTTPATIFDALVAELGDPRLTEEERQAYRFVWPA